MDCDIFFSCRAKYLEFLWDKSEIESEAACLTKLANYT